MGALRHPYPERGSAPCQGSRVAPGRLDQRPCPGERWPARGIRRPWGRYDHRLATRASQPASSEQFRLPRHTYQSLAEAADLALNASTER